MNITDMILVTENHKGSETNSVMDFMDFLEFTVKESWLSLKELAEDMVALGRTCGGKEKWMESCFAENTTLFARYCADEEAGQIPFPSAKPVQPFLLSVQE